MEQISNISPIRQLSVSFNRACNETGRGYTTISKGGEAAIYKDEGKIKTTTMSDKEQPDTRFEGEAVNVKPGLGKKMGKRVAYKGYFTSPTDYVVEWRKVE